MTRSSGTIAGGTALDLLSALHTAVDAHAAWEFVETVTNTPSAGDEWRVYKCLAASNTHGADFYILVMYDVSVSTQKLFFSVAEGYNAATNEFTNYAPFLTSGVSVAADATVGTTVTDPNNLSTTTLQGQIVGDATGDLSVDTAAVSFDYDISVTNDRVIVATSVISDQSCVYVGAFENFTQITNNVPLCVLQVTQNTDNAVNGSKGTTGTTTRHPGRENQALNLAHFVLCGGSAAAAPWTSGPYSTTTADSMKDLFLNGAIASRIMVKVGASNSTNANVTGYLRGLLYDMLIIQIETTVVVGDTFTFGSDVYDVVSKRAAAGPALLIKQGV